MHELSVTEDIMRIVKDHAGRNDAKSVTDIYLVIGELVASSTTPSSSTSTCFRPTPSPKAQTLHFKRIKTRFRCRKCGTEFEPEKRDWTCPSARRWAATSSRAKSSTSRASKVTT